MTTHPHLEGLIRKWRRIAADQFIVRKDREYIAGYDAALRKCANELSEALAALPGGGVDELRAALQRFVADAQEVDLGGGDAVVTTCESLEAAKAALGIPRPYEVWNLLPCAHCGKREPCEHDESPTPNPHEADRNE